MSLFSFGNKKERFGILIDIGSGSVLTAIVHSTQNQKHPMIVWAHREHTALKHIESVEQSARAVLAALMNASLKLENDGRKALQTYRSGAKLTSIQCSIAAPWSYTVTKSIKVNQEEEITITDHLIDELVYAAQQQVEEDLKKHADSVDLGLTVITKATMDLLSNGYRVKHPEGEHANSLNLTQATVVAQQYMTDGISEVQQKLFPAATAEAMSFILMFYCTVRSLYPHTDDTCLVDVTDEASEIGIVRDGSLKYSTHISFGLFSLARELSEVCSIPLSEALGHLRATDVTELKRQLPESRHDDIDAIFDAYIERLSALLNETGDSLSIPKKILLHVESSFNPLFEHLIKRAAKMATRIDHVVISLAGELLTNEHKERLKEQIGDQMYDTALILNSEFFHKQKHCLDFDYS